MFRKIFTWIWLGVWSVDKPEVFTEQDFTRSVTVVDLEEEK